VSEHVSIARLYADPDGASHFGAWEWPAAETAFAPPAPPVRVTAPEAAERALLLHIPAGWTSRPHPAPRRQLMVVVRGTLESTVSDGETRSFPPGSAVLVEDTFGAGHSTRTVGGEVVVAVTQLA
jgi:quercetin dioxygenase-like cupin family protein